MTPRPTSSRRSYQKRSSYGPWIALAVAVVVVLIVVIVVRDEHARRPPPDATPAVDPAVQQRLEVEAVQEKERQRQHSIRVLRQKLKRLDRQIAATQERLKDKWSWKRDQDLAEAKELATKRAEVVEELARLGE